jgi:hypothetical protein
MILNERTDKAVTKVGYAAGLSNGEIIKLYALKLWSTTQPLLGGGAHAFRFVCLITRTFSVSLA